MNNKDNRTTARGLARYAREYFDAAIAADDMLGARKGYELVAPHPVMFLIAHSVELILKAFLRFNGYSVDDIRKLNHSLMDCWQNSTQNGIEKHASLTEEEVEILGLLSDLHRSTELRYIQTGFKTFPVFGPLQVMTEKLLNAICPLVGYR